MKKNRISIILGAFVLCIAAAGCGTQTATETSSATAVTEEAASEAAAAATTSAAAEIAEPLEEEMLWEDMDDAYLTGIHAEDYVQIPEEYDHMTVEAEKPVDPTDDEVDDRIRIELQNHTTTSEVDRKVKEGDTVSIEFSGKVDGKDLEGGSGTYDLVIGSDTFIDGFEDGLIGAKKDETRVLELTFPEDYHEESLAGKDVVFTVTVNKVSETETPKLTDDFVRSLNLTNAFGKAVTEVEDYEDYIRSNMIEERESAYENTVLSAIVSDLINESTFTGELPENLVEKYNYLETRKLEYRALLNYMDLASYVKAVYGATDENYEDMIRDMAEYYTRQELVLQAIADREDLNVSEEELQKVIAEYTASDSSITSADDLRRIVKEALRDDMMTKNVLDWLYDHCKVEKPSEEEEEEETDSEEASTGETAAEETAAEETTEESEEETDDSDKESDSDKNSDEEKEESSGEDREKEESGEDSEEDDTAARHDN